LPITPAPTDAAGQLAPSRPRRQYRARKRARFAAKSRQLHDDKEKVMKAVALAFLAACAPLAAQAAVPEQVQFKGSVLRDDAVAVLFDLQVPSGEGTTLEMEDGSRLELDTRGVVPGGEGVRMRLLSPDGKVLHQASTPDPEDARLFFAYRVRDSRAT